MGYFKDEEEINDVNKQTELIFEILKDEQWHSARELHCTVQNWLFSLERLGTKMIVETKWDDSPMQGGLQIKVRQKRDINDLWEISQNDKTN